MLRAMMPYSSDYTKIISSKMKRLPVPNGNTTMVRVPVVFHRYEKLLRNFRRNIPEEASFECVAVCYILGVKRGQPEDKAVVFDLINGLNYTPFGSLCQMVTESQLLQWFPKKTQLEKFKWQVETLDYVFEYLLRTDGWKNLALLGNDVLPDAWDVEIQDAIANEFEKFPAVVKERMKWVYVDENETIPVILDPSKHVKYLSTDVYPINLPTTMHVLWVDNAPAEYVPAPDPDEDAAPITVPIAPPREPVFVDLTVTEDPPAVVPEGVSNAVVAAGGSNAVMAAGGSNAEVPSPVLTNSATLVPTPSSDIPIKPKAPKPRLSVITESPGAPKALGAGPALPAAKFTLMTPIPKPNQARNYGSTSFLSMQSVGSNAMQSNAAAGSALARTVQEVVQETPEKVTADPVVAVLSRLFESEPVQAPPGGDFMLTTPPKATDDDHNTPLWMRETSIMQDASVVLGPLPQDNFGDESIVPHINDTFVNTSVILASPTLDLSNAKPLVKARRSRRNQEQATPSVAAGKGKRSVKTPSKLSD